MARSIRDEDSDNTPVVLENVTSDIETERALRCFVEGEPHWVPKSQITDDSEVYARGHTGKLVVTGWFARKEGLGG